MELSWADQAAQAHPGERSPLSLTTQAWSLHTFWTLHLPWEHFFLSVKLLKMVIF